MGVVIVTKRVSIGTFSTIKLKVTFRIPTLSNLLLCVATVFVMMMLTITVCGDVELTRAYPSRKLKKKQQVKILTESLTTKINYLFSKTDDLENRSRRENIVLHGIPEKTGNEEETWADCEEQVRNIIQHKLEMENPQDESQVVIDRAHRLGRKNSGDDMRPNINAYLGPDMPSPVHPKMHTPTLDALASRSLVLKRAYVSQALCSPSRTALLTSRRPDTSHIWQIGPYFRYVGGNFTTLPEYFKRNGYRTIGMGKIFHPGSSSGGDDPVSWTDPYFHAQDKYEDHDQLLCDAISEEREKAQPLQDQMIAGNAIKTLQEVAPRAKSGEQPFFVAVGFHKPHISWNYPARFNEFYPLESLRPAPNYYAPIGMPAVAWHNFENFGRFKDVKAYNLSHIGAINFTFPPTLTLELRQAYYSCISYIDYELGRVIQELDNLGLSNNTIISFWGDHGWQLGEHSEWEKQTNFEDATHAPMMIHVPGVTDKGVVTEHLTEFVDLYPTLVEAAELPKIDTCPPNSQNISLCTEGTSMVPLMTNPTMTNWKTAAFSQYPRGGDGLHGDITMGYTMRTEMYRYTEWINFKGRPIYEPMWDQVKAAELYDHAKDPEENWNRADDPSYKDVRVELSRKLKKGWRGALPNKRV